MRAVSNKSTSDTYSADEFNELMSNELQNAVTTSGQSLTAADLNQLGKALSIYSAGGDFYTDGGSANTYTLSVIGSKQSPPALFDGMKVSFIAGNTNTGASTVTAPGLGPVAIEYNGAALAANKIVADEIIELVYNSVEAAFDLINSISGIDDQSTTLQMTITDALIDLIADLKITSAGNFPLFLKTTVPFCGIKLSDDTTTADGNRIFGHGDFLELRTLDVARVVIDQNSVDFDAAINAAGFIDSGAFASNGATGGVEIDSGGKIRISQTLTSTTPVMEFHNPNNEVGSIEMSGSATAYLTSSDEKLKTEFDNIDGDIAWQMIKDAYDQKIIGSFEFLVNPGVTVWGYNAWKLVDNQPGFGGHDRRGPDNARELEIGSEYEVPVFDENGDPVMEDVIEIKQRQQTFKKLKTKTVKKKGTNGKMIDVEIPMTEPGEVKIKAHVNIIDGKAIFIPEKIVQGEVKMYDEFPMFDENDEPMMVDYKDVIGTQPKVKIEIVGPAKVDQSKRLVVVEAGLHKAILKIEALEGN